MTNFITFYDEMTSLADEGKAVDIVYLDFSTAFDSVSHKIFTENLSMHGLEEQTVRLTENWMNDWAQRVVISDTKTPWRLVTSSIHQWSVLGPVLFKIIIIWMMRLRVPSANSC
ncbi:rna-directed dna polymerase from mobile element jockey-like [Pitangus sulphuratus]|nr:rna-directed dna polymerase from mobile element jockey-like [Pitangus sulphuratus]